MRKLNPLALALVSTALFLGACSSPSSNNTSATSTSNASTTTKPPITATVSVTPTTISPAGHVGDTISLPASDQNPAMLVTLVAVIDPAPGADQFAIPVGSGRFVGVQLRITPSGNSFQDDPNADTVLEDSLANPYSPTTVNLQNCSAFGTGRAMPAGQSTTGCLTFQLESDATATELSFTPGGEFGNVSAEWHIP